MSENDVPAGTAKPRNKIAPFLRKCWTTRGLLVIGAVSCASPIFLLVTAGGLEIPGLILNVFRCVMIFCAVLCTARLALKVAVALFVSFPHNVFRLCIPNSLLNKVQHAQLAGFMLLLSGVLFFGTGALVFKEASPLGFFLVSISLIWLGCAVWYRLSAPWRERLEILIFGDKYQPYDFADKITSILILIVILSSPLPMLNPFVVKAKYAAESIPTEGYIRTRVQIYHTANARLPGVQRYIDAATGKEEYANTSVISEVVKSRGMEAFNGAVQSLDMYNDGPLNSNRLIYYSDGAAGKPRDVPSELNIAHFACDLDVSVVDLLGKNSKPRHYQYLVLDSGFGDTSYSYAIGAFGDGHGLETGTGYAVLEIVNPNNAVHPKITVVWQRYKEEHSAGPICFVVASDSTTNVWVVNKKRVETQLPIHQGLIDNGTPIADDSSMLEKMRGVGWEIF